MRTTVVLRHLVFDYSYYMNDPQPISISGSAAWELLPPAQQAWVTQQQLALRTDCLRDLARCYSHLRILADLNGSQATYFLLRWGSAVPEFHFS